MCGEVASIYYGGEGGFGDILQTIAVQERRNVVFCVLRRDDSILVGIVAFPGSQDLFVAGTKRCVVLNGIFIVNPNVATVIDAINMCIRRNQGRIAIGRWYDETLLIFPIHNKAFVYVPAICLADHDRN